MTRSMISSVVSKTMYFCPEVSAMTVSGVISMCSIKSEFTINGVWFNLVILIIGHSSSAGRVYTMHIADERIPLVPTMLVLRTAMNHRQASGKTQDDLALRPLDLSQQENSTPQFRM